MGKLIAGTFLGWGHLIEGEFKPENPLIMTKLKVGDTLAFITEENEPAPPNYSGRAGGN